MGGAPFAAAGEAVHIKDEVYVGSCVSSLPGVMIREGKKAASGAFVTKHVSARAVVVGVSEKSKRSIVKYQLDT